MRPAQIDVRAADGCHAHIVVGPRKETGKRVSAKGVLPRACNPTATLTMFCSAIYPCQKWSGYASPNTCENVEFFTSPDIATTCGFAAPSRFSAKPYASRVATLASLA
jgi:hypothetical protein